MYYNINLNKTQRDIDPQIQPLGIIDVYVSYLQEKCYDNCRN